MTKKSSPSWNIAATHFLTAGCAIPLLVIIGGGLMIAFFVSPGVLKIFLMIGLRILAIWLGVKYSAGYLKKHYEITDKKEVVKLATFYLVIVTLGITVYQSTRAIQLDSTELLANIIYLFVSASFFYIFSNKYIVEEKENTTEKTSENSTQI